LESPTFSIAAVEQDTGISKELLRMWERRYQFPQPGRDASGDRTYPLEQVERLRLIKRLMDQGHRPGKLMATSAPALAALSAAGARLPPSTDVSEGPDSGLDAVLDFLTRHDAAGFQQALQQRLSQHGLQRFVVATVAPLTGLVGQGWETGRIGIFEEHLFTELTTRVLRQALDALPAGPRSPRVLLTTAPTEAHALGLLMAEALLALEGAHCIPFGTEMPLPDIARAAAAHQVEVVALSFSASFPARQVPDTLRRLRELLPPEVALWAGGSGVARVAALDGVVVLQGLDDGVRALQARRRVSR
jgi:methanogenic corrinoid protein MtbC1